MPESFRDRLTEEVPCWVEDGLIEPAQAQRILERYESHAPRAGGSEVAWTSALLYGTAAVLLGAAAIAFVFVGLDPGFKPPYLLAIGVTLALAGLGLYVVDPERDLLVDALLAAALAPLAAGPIEATMTVGETLAYGAPALGLPLAYLVWRREQPFLPALSVIGFTVAMQGTAFDIVADDAVSAAYWVLGQGLLLAGLVAVDRLMRDRDATAPVSLAVLAGAISGIPFLLETVDVSGSETVELVIGGVLLAILTVGVLVRHRGLVLGAAIGVGIDAIVFAFDVGGVALGTGLLVALAVLLIWQAEALKGWLENAGAPG